MADLAVGQVVADREYRITRENLVRYAGASGDFNPIHWNDRVARAVGLPGVLAHGMLTMALAGRLLTDWAGDPGAVVEYSVRFSRPVVVPDDDHGVAVQVSATVTEVRDDGLVAVDLAVKVDDQKVLTQARALARPPKTDGGS
ncbi:MaoC family dehydratase [Phytoactinopolyspora halotolerans]|uniref:MaoC family dehydratase n=1 Tax=Phytoactinopolyspora halotolerans TaxID=1981512 RepID=A0A6L9S538_9ACTN|nr:MaoC family dehydratase [Phytoactinopolyspora halotolerans]NEE00276.1 MaoC family dehydratase [Phytoactinopolyspora halotolerans]